jgi:hypothetical protein
MSTRAAFHLKDIASADTGQALLHDWLRMVNAETTALAPWFELQAEYARQLQQQAMGPWLALWRADPDTPAKH